MPTMLRLLVLLLVLLNATYFAWSQGMLRAYGWAPAQQTEPQRLQQQIRPEAIQILSAEEARRALQVAQTPPTPPTPPKPPECLQAGLFDVAQTETVRKALETALPATAWTLEPVIEPGRWIVYMGKFSNPVTLARKKAELEKLKVKLQPLEKAELAPGLSLGAFETQAQAQAELKTLQRRGVRTAKVVQERAELRQSLLRIPAADEALKAKLEEIKPALGGQPLRSCSK
jgi:hypothetical protein